MAIDDPKLIQLVRKNKCLYDTKNARYKSGVYREQIWTNIASKLCYDDSLTSQDCKTRWTHLRHTFRKYLNRVKNPNTNTWPLTKYMLFLVPYLENLDNPAIVEEFVKKHQDDDVHNDSDSISITYDNNEKLMLQDRPGSVINENEWRMQNDLSIEPDTMVQTTKNDFSERPKSTVQLNNYFNLIRDTIESFSPVQQIDVRRKIYEIVYEAEMQNALSGNYPHSNSLSFNNTF